MPWFVSQHFDDTPPVCDGRREDQHGPAIGRQFDDLGTRGRHEGIVVDQRFDFFADELAGADDEDHRKSARLTPALEISGHR